MPLKGVPENRQAFSQGLSVYVALSGTCCPGQSSENVLFRWGLRLPNTSTIIEESSAQVSNIVFPARRIDSSAS